MYKCHMFTKCKFLNKSYFQSYKLACFYRTTNIPKYGFERIY